MGFFLRYTLGRFLARGILEVRGFGLGLDDLEPLVADNLTLLVDTIARVLIAGPALLMFDFGNDSVGRLNVKALVRLHHFFRQGMNLFSPFE